MTILHCFFLSLSNTTLIHLKSHICIVNLTRCWLTEPAVLYFTIGYFAVLFLFNAVIFTKVTVKVVQLRRAGAPKKSISRRELHTVLGMACLLGITWGVMFFNFGPLQEPALYAFSILNSLHGKKWDIYSHNASLISEAMSRTKRKAFCKAHKLENEPINITLLEMLDALLSILLIIL